MATKRDMSIALWAVFSKRILHGRAAVAQWACLLVLLQSLRTKVKERNNRQQQHAKTEPKLHKVNTGQEAQQHTTTRKHRT